MSSEMIVVLVLVVLSAGAVFDLARHSKKNVEQSSPPEVAEED